MKKNFKKVIAVLLSLLVLMGTMSVGAFAEDVTEAPVTEDEGHHRNMYEVIYDMFVEFFNFLKYIFYDVFRGDPVPEI